MDLPSVGDTELHTKLRLKVLSARDNFKAIGMNEMIILK